MSVKAFRCFSCVVYIRFIIPLQTSYSNQPIMNETFALRLKSARSQAKLSMRELAEKAGNVVTFNSIKKYEDGLMTPEPTTMIALANALGVKVEYFMRPIKV